AGRSISDPSNLYFMRAYIENLLGYNTNAIRSQLSCEGFILDTTQDITNLSGTFTAAVAAIPAQGGIAAAAAIPAIPAMRRWINQDQVDRAALITNNRPLQLSGKIHCDLFQQDKPLLPGV